MLSQRERPCTVAVKTLLFHHSLSSKTSKMDSKCCSRCHSVLLLTSFLKNVDADPASRKYSASITCREKSRKRCAPAIAMPQPPAQRPRTATLGPVYPLLLLCTRLIDCRLLFSVKSCLSHQSKIRPHVQFSLEYSSSLSNQSSIKSYLNPKFLNLSPPSFLKPGLSPSSQSNLRSQAFSRQNSGNIYSDFIPPWKR